MNEEKLREGGKKQKKLWNFPSRKNGKIKEMIVAEVGPPTQN